MRLLLSLVICLALVAPLYARPTTSATLNIDLGDDDADQETANSQVSANGEQVNLQKAAAGFLFTNVQIQQGFAVHSASVSFVAASSSNSAATTVIRAEATCTPAPYVVHDNDKDKEGDDGEDGDSDGKDKTSGPTGLAARTLTTASVSWSTSWVKDRQYITADVSALIQEIVNLPTWVPGHSISLIFSFGSGSTQRKAYSKEGSGSTSSRIPKLTVSYDAPALCPALVDGAGGVTTYTDGQYGHLYEGTTAVQSCGDGYRGCETQLQCTSNGVWTGTPVVCSLMRVGGDSEDMAKVLLQNGAGPLHCNDGTSPMYYIRQSKSNKWVIQFEGGGLCYNAQSCQPRIGTTKFFTTSDFVPNSPPGFGNAATRQGNGIFSRQDYNTYWKDANVVFVHYCSSDMWTGTKTAALNFGLAFPFWFQGDLIATAVIAELALKYDLGCASEILLSGEAASGGVGLTVQMEKWAPQIRSLAPHASLKCLSEGAWVMPPVANIGDLSPSVLATPINLAPWSKASPPQFFGTGQHIQNAQSVWSPVIPAECIAAGYKGNQPIMAPGFDPAKNTQWKCYFLPYTHKFKTIPTFYNQAQFDAPMIAQSGLVANPVGSTVYPDPASWAYIDANIGYPTRFFLQTQLRPQDGAYTLKCIGHKLTGKVEWSTANYNGLTLRDAFQAWYTNTDPSARFITVDDTSTDGTADGNSYASNPTCPVVWI